MMQESSHQATFDAFLQTEFEVWMKGCCYHTIFITYYYRLETTLSQIAVKQCYFVGFMTPNCTKIRKVTLFLSEQKHEKK